jgi:excisionase family DNA binding protein
MYTEERNDGHIQAYSMKNTSSDLISLAEAAHRYGLSMAYLRQLAMRGRLAARKIGRNWVTTSAAVEEYIASRQKRGAYREDIRRDEDTDEEM